MRTKKLQFSGIYCSVLLVYTYFLELTLAQNATVTDCVNSHPDEYACDYWADRSECTINPRWMLPNCQRSCYSCSAYETTCVNIEDDAICERLAETGQCANNLTVVQNCRWSCGNCRELFEGEDLLEVTTRHNAGIDGSGDEQSSGAVEDSTQSSVNESTICEDSNVNCAYWALNDQCRLNPDYMLVFCQISCNSCDHIVSSTSVPQSATPMPEQVVTTVTEPPTTPPSTVVIMTTGAVERCEDREELCEFWAGGDECTKNPDWMMENCRLSCNACDFVSRADDEKVTGPPVTAPDSTTTTIETEIPSGPPRTTTPPNCEDTDVLCGYWAINGECQNNPQWMPQNCPVSCNTCDLRTTVQDGQGTTGRPATKPIDDRITTVSTSTTTIPPTTTTTKTTVQPTTTSTSTTTTTTTARATTEREPVDDGSGDVDTTTTFGPSTAVRGTTLPKSTSGSTTITTSQATTTTSRATATKTTAPATTTTTTTTTTAKPPTTAEPTTTSTTSTTTTTTTSGTRTESASTTASSNTSQVTSTAPPVCKNQDAMCDYWASIGECTTNMNYMAYSCPVSCNTCHLVAGGSTSAATATPSTTSQVQTATAKPITTATLPPSTTTTTPSATLPPSITTSEGQTTTLPPSTTTTSTSTATTQQPVVPQTTTSVEGPDTGLTKRDVPDAISSADRMTTATGRPATTPTSTTAPPTTTTTVSIRPELGFYVSNETHILLVTEDARLRMSVATGENIVGLAVDLEEHFLFWSDNGPNKKGIYRSDLDGLQATKIIDTDVKEVNGLTVDWVSRHIYWTDAQTGLIEMSDYDGLYRRIIVSSGLMLPRGIYADPINGYLFFTDQGIRSVERTNLDGSNRRVISNEDVYWPNQITVDYRTQKVYWVDAWKKKLYSASVHGNDVSTAVDLAPYVGQNPAFGLVAVEGTALVGVWGTGQVWNVDTEQVDPVPQMMEDGLGKEVLFSMASTNYRTQPAGSNPCGDPNKGGCAYLCVPTSSLQYRCMCPSYGGRVLDAGGKNCFDPDEVVLFAEAGTGLVGFIGGSSNDKYIVGRSSRPVAVGYDPIEKVVYWSDVKERSIYRTHLYGYNREVFLNASSGIGSVDGLFVDWVHRKLYFSNMDMVTFDGTAFTWHRIEAIGLDRAMRRVIVTNVEQPRGIHVDMQNGYLYYTDWGTEGAVMRSALDGTDSVVLKDKLDNPNGVTIINDLVYVIDSHAKTREEDSDSSRDGALYRIGVNGLGWEMESTVGLKTPFGISASTNVLYISDWDLGEIIEVTTSSGEQKTVASGLDEPLGVFYTTVTAPSITAEDACLTSDCEDVCSLGSESQPVCGCASFGTLTLGADGITCTEPDNVLLVADMNRIIMRGLGGVDNHSYTVTNGNMYSSSYSALVYDEQDRSAYYSDGSRGAIYRVNLENGATELVSSVGYAVDGMVIADDILYFTVYDNGTIAMLDLTQCSLGECEPVVLATGLDAPRGIAVDSSRGHLYWSEVGNRPQVKVMSLIEDESSMTPTVIITNITSPNSLYLDQDLYILDGATGVVYRCNVESIEESVCFYWTTVPGEGPFFSMSIWDSTTAMYSDWGLHHVASYNLESGSLTVMVDDLTRPAGVVVSHPDRVEDYCLDSPCSQTCEPYPGGFNCLCGQGQKLGQDGFTCQSAVDVTSTGSTVTEASSTTVSSTMTTRECMDSHDLCNTWARFGECERNAEYMSQTCALSCGFCGVVTFSRTSTRSITAVPTIASTSTTTPTTTTRACVDESDDCPQWAETGQCELNPEYMLANCLISCGVCAGPTVNTTTSTTSTSTSNTSRVPTTTTTTPTTPTTTRECVDTDDQCPLWARSGQCEVNPSYMLANCLISCGVCEGPTINVTESTSTSTSTPAATTSQPATTSTTVTTTTTTRACVDAEEDCSIWAQTGQCELNPEYMLENCLISCGVCAGPTLNTTSSTTANTTSKPTTTFTTTTSPTTTTGTTTTTTRPCVDVSDDCVYWAETNQCDLNPSYMLSNCLISCGVCAGPTINSTTSTSSSEPNTTTTTMTPTTNETTTASTTTSSTTVIPITTTTATITTTTRPCVDADDGCPVWARTGQCELNPEYMMNNCLISCGVCAGPTLNITTTTTSNTTMLTDTTTAMRPATTTTSTTTTTTRACADANKDCSLWARTGQCELNPSYMMENCLISCGVCVVESNDTTSTTPESTSTAAAETDGVPPTTSTNTSTASSTTSTASSTTTSPTTTARTTQPPTTTATTTTATTTTTTTQPTTTVCADQDLLCPVWARFGECENNPSYMNGHCPLACGICSLPTTPTLFPPTTSNATQSTPATTAPTTSTTSPVPTTSTTVTTTTTTRPCVDMSDQCPMWAQTGQCELNPEYMLGNCLISCGVCAGPALNTTSSTTTSTTSKPTATVTTTAPPTTTPTTTRSPTTRECIDADIQCPNWARTGQCDRNPEYMLENCLISCGVCGSTSSATTLTRSTTSGTTSTAVPTSSTTLRTTPFEATPRECFDLNQLCPVWARFGECQRNIHFMRINCLVSCGFCGSTTVTSTAASSTVSTTESKTSSSTTQTRTVSPRITTVLETTQKTTPTMLPATTILTSLPPATTTVPPTTTPTTLSPTSTRTTPAPTSPTSATSPTTRPTTPTPTTPTTTTLTTPTTTRPTTPTPTSPTTTRPTTPTPTTPTTAKPTTPTPTTHSISTTERATTPTPTTPTSLPTKPTTPVLTTPTQPPTTPTTRRPPATPPPRPPPTPPSLPPLPPFTPPPPVTTTISAGVTTTSSGPPPVFITCPNDRRVYTDSESKEVWWLDPKAQGYDGTNISRLEVTHQPGSNFSVGKTKVVYTATDKYGVQGQCSFNITVLVQAFQCEGTPNPLFGEMQCEQINFIWRCSAECNVGYVINQQYNRQHACRSGGWDPPFPQAYDNMICVRPQAYETVIKVMIEFNGTCAADNSQFENRFIENLLQKLKQYPVCGDEGGPNYGMCDSVNYDLVCQTTEVRRKRQTSVMTIIIKTKKPTQGDPTVDADYNAKIGQVEEALKKGDLFVVVDDVTYTAVNMPDPAAPEPGCDSGEMDHNGRCAVCPVGSRENRERGVCEPCPQGTFQDSEGQTSCTRCRTGHISRLGSYTRRQCIPIATVPSTQEPKTAESSGDWSIWLIVVVCVVAALVLLIAVIIACISFRRVVKNKGEVKMDYEKATVNGAVGPRFVNPSVVARPDSEVATGKDTTPRYVAVTRVPSNRATQTRYGRLPSGQVVRMVPVQTVPRVRKPVKARAKKYDVSRTSPRTAPAGISRKGMYRKQYQNGVAAVHSSPARQTDAAYSTITYPNGLHYQARPATAMSQHSYTGWHSLSTQDKVTM